MTELPKSWELVALADIAQVVRGVTYNKSDARATAAVGDLPIIRATNISRVLSLDSQMVYVPERYVNEIQRLQVGDIVVATSSGSARVVGKSAQLGRAWAGSFGAFCSVIRPSRELAAGYLAHFVSSPTVRGLWRSAAQGTNINNLKTSDLAGTCVPIPPTAEQERIVAFIEEQFSRLDAGVAALERVRWNLRRMRVSVLERAVTGQLFPGSFPPDDRIADLPDGWRWQPLEKIVTRVRNGIFVSRPVVDSVGPAILRISAVRPLSLDISDVRYVPDAFKLDRTADFTLSEGDLLFTRYSGNPEYVGACAMVPAGAPSLLYPDKLIRVQVDRSVVVPRFIEIAASAGRSREEIRRRAKTTAGQTGISGADLRTVPFPVPPLDTQEIIIGEVDRLLTCIAMLEDEVRQALLRSAMLHSSVLAAAFAGRVVPQDYDDEAASVLLQRVAAEWASTSSNWASTSRSAKLLA